MKNYTSGKRIVIGFLALLILGLGKLSAQSLILGHTYLGTFNGHAYYMSDCPTAWYDALFAAEEMGGYLATITSQEEDEFLAPFAPYIDCYSIYNGGDHRTGGAWIGLLTNDNDQDGICQMVSWINGEPIGYTNWSQEYLEPISGYCGPAGIIGYPGGNDVGYCYPNAYRWFTNYYTNATSRYIVEFDQNPGCSNPNKSYVCHNGITICVNNDAVQAHINHGDYAGPCGPCNSNAFTVQHNPANADVSNDAQLSFRPEVENGNVGQIFPNPVTDQLHVDLRQLTAQAWIRMYLVTGEKVYEQIFQHGNTASLDVSSLPLGIILVEVRSGEEVWIRKVVKL